MCSQRERVLSKYRFAQVKRIREVCNKERFKINTVNLSTYIETRLSHAHKSEKKLQNTYLFYLLDLLRFVVPLYCVYTSLPSFSRNPVLTELWIPIILFRWTNIFGWFWILLLLSFSFFVTLLEKKMSQREIELNPNNQ